jgi:lysozyme family protein
MSNFDQCIKVLLHNEGGFQCNPKDKGNYTPDGKLVGTKYGISAASYPNEDIKNLTPERATEIYHKDYWNDCHLDLINDANAAMQIFDHSVNAGGGEAVKEAQRIVEVDDDGQLGPITAKAINLYPNFVPSYKQARVNYYNKIARNDANDRDFLNGWIERVQNTHV